MSTPIPSGVNIKRDWFVLDAQDAVLGRLASKAANLLMGKHKPVYTRFLDMGDHVVVINAAKIRLSGRKLQDKFYRHHTNYPGGLKEISAGKLLEKHPERLIEKAVQGMLPKGPLGRRMVRKLKVYAGPQHPHEAQQPAILEIEAAARVR